MHFVHFAILIKVVSQIIPCYAYETHFHMHAYNSKLILGIGRTTCSHLQIGHLKSKSLVGFIC